MYNSIIIGGGISGLNTCYNLEKKGEKCLLIEKNNILGGRIKYNKTHNYELGAGRFSKRHKQLIILLKELKLFDNLIEIPNK